MKGTGIIEVGPFKAMRLGVALLLPWCALLCMLAGMAHAAAVHLQGGTTGPYKWSVQASRPGGINGGLRPCLSLTIRGSSVPFSDTRCASLERRPLALGLVDELDSPQVALFAMAFGPEYAKVTLYFNGPAKDRTVALREISSAKAKKAKLRPFRYFALSLLGKSCLERFVGLSDVGAVLFDSELMHCREDE